MSVILFPVLVVWYVRTQLVLIRVLVHLATHKIKTGV